MFDIMFLLGVSRASFGISTYAIIVYKIIFQIAYICVLDHSATMLAVVMIGWDNEGMRLLM